jgi:hypothetical protein
LKRRFDVRVKGSAASVGQRRATDDPAVNELAMLIKEHGIYFAGLPEHVDRATTDAPPQDQALSNSSCQTGGYFGVDVAAKFARSHTCFDFLAERAMEPTEAGRDLLA